MSADDWFRLAGEAACLLEERGFVAVARKREEVVALELFKRVDGEQRALRHLIAETPASAEALAQLCAVEFAVGVASLQSR